MILTEVYHAPVEDFNQLWSYNNNCSAIFFYPLKLCSVYSVGEHFQPQKWCCLWYRLYEWRKWHDIMLGLRHDDSSLIMHIALWRYMWCYIRCWSATRNILHNSVAVASVAKGDCIIILLFVYFIYLFYPRCPQSIIHSPCTTVFESFQTSKGRTHLENYLTFFILFFLAFKMWGD